ncbi:MAG: SMI1/KNR4 family protein [Faecalimonas sp.]|nr:SMI1/KNR4 family protein [Faecalimonas sp.]
MSNFWRFKIELKDQTIFETIQQDMSKKFPDELKDFIIDHNAASPDQNSILINGIERIVNSVLSFNKKEEEATTYFSVSQVIGDKTIIPFASDPFGNYFCYLLKSEKIGYYDHEEQKICETSLSLKEFIDDLY